MKTLSSFILGSVLVLATVLLLNPLSTAQGPPRGPLAGDLIPVGVVVPFAGPVANIPDGWLLCDGRSLLPAVYPDLFDVIGFNHGEDETPGQFVLPDYRGRFLRGVAHGDSRAPDRDDRFPLGPDAESDAVGSVQLYATAIPNERFNFNIVGSHSHVASGAGFHGHTYDLTVPATSGVTLPSVAVGSGGVAGTVGGAGFHSHTTDARGNHSHGITGGGDLETRPVNAYVNWIIKY